MRARYSRLEDRLMFVAWVTMNMSQRIAERPAPVTFNLSQCGWQVKAACACRSPLYTGRMRNFLSALALMAAFAPAACAQVTAEIVFDQEQFLRSESLPIRLRINNLSGQALKLGNGPEWLRFTVESREGKPLRKTGEIPLPKAGSIESAKTGSLNVDLMPYFNLSEPGHYSVKATIRIPQ